MPIVQVFVPASADVADRLDRTCAAVADTLGLTPGDVIATHVPVAETVRPGHDAPVWPVLVVHSSPRPADDVRRAVAALQELAGSWTTTGEAWVSWQERA